MSNNLEQQIIDRKITRLCHFTKSKNFIQMVNHTGKILATENLPDIYRDANDHIRLDKRGDHICCSIQYPNYFYWRRIKDNDLLFKEWVILLINPRVILNKGTLFSPVNAATKGGSYIYQAIDRGLEPLFEDRVTTEKRSLVRSTSMPLNCPTDIQAEVMILNEIDMEQVEGIIVGSEKQAKSEYVKLKLCGKQDQYKIIVCPEIFQEQMYSNLQKSGILPKEYEWKGKE